MTNATMPKISSPRCGRTGYSTQEGRCVPSSALPSANTADVRITVPPAGCSGTAGPSAEDEREGQTEDGQRLGEGEAEERERLEHAAGLGLAGDAVDVRREDQSDTDTRADRRQAVPQDR